MASLRDAARKQHPQNPPKGSSFAPVSQAAPLAYHMTPEMPAPDVPQRVQTTGNQRVHVPGKRGK